MGFELLNNCRALIWLSSEYHWSKIGGTVNQQLDFKAGSFTPPVNDENRACLGSIDGGTPLR